MPRHKFKANAPVASKTMVWLCTFPLLLLSAYLPLYSASASTEHQNSPARQRILGGESSSEGPESAPSSTSSQFSSSNATMAPERESKCPHPRQSCKYSEYVAEEDMLKIGQAELCQNYVPLTEEEYTSLRTGIIADLKNFETLKSYHWAPLDSAYDQVDSREPRLAIDLTCHGDATDSIKSSDRSYLLEKRVLSRSIRKRGRSEWYKFHAEDIADRLQALAYGEADVLHDIFDKAIKECEGAMKMARSKQWFFEPYLGFKEEVSRSVRTSIALCVRRLVHRARAYLPEVIFYESDFELESMDNYEVLLATRYALYMRAECRVDNHKSWLAVAATGQKAWLDSYQFAGCKGLMHTVKSHRDIFIRFLRRPELVAFVGNRMAQIMTKREPIGELSYWLKLLEDVDSLIFDQFKFFGIDDKVYFLPESIRVEDVQVELMDSDHGPVSQRMTIVSIFKYALPVVMSTVFEDLSERMKSLPVGVLSGDEILGERWSPYFGALKCTTFIIDKYRSWLVERIMSAAEQCDTFEQMATKISPALTQTLVDIDARRPPNPKVNDAIKRVKSHEDLIESLKLCLFKHQ